MKTRLISAFSLNGERAFVYQLVGGGQKDKRENLLNSPVSFLQVSAAKAGQSTRNGRFSV